MWFKVTNSQTVITNWVQFHGFAPRRILSLWSTFSTYMQAPNFNTSCVSEERLVTWRTHVHKPKFPANPWNTHDISTNLSAFIRNAYGKQSLRNWACPWKNCTKFTYVKNKHSPNLTRGWHISNVMMLSGLIKQRRQLPAVHCWQAQTHWITEPFDGMYPKRKMKKKQVKKIERVETNLMAIIRGAQR